MNHQRGFTLIELMIVIAIIAIIAAIAIPSLIEARKGANESAAIGALRTIVVAQSLFREGDKDGNGTLDYATSIAALVSASLIESSFASEGRQGYGFQMEDGADQFSWECVARPLTGNRSGDRSFRVEEDGVIYFRKSVIPPGKWTPIGG